MPGRWAPPIAATSSATPRRPASTRSTSRPGGSPRVRGQRRTAGSWSKGSARFPMFGHFSPTRRTARESPTICATCSKPASHQSRSPRQPREHGMSRSSSCVGRSIHVSQLHRSSREVCSRLVTRCRLNGLELRTAATTLHAGRNTGLNSRNTSVGRSTFSVRLPCVDSGIGVLNSYPSRF